MAKEMPLLAELSNCLSAYKETVERILTCIESACDPNHKKHDSPVILQVQDLLSIDAELKRHLRRMDEWKERQNKIETLEQTLATLSNRVNEFAKSLSKAQTALQSCLATAQKIQRASVPQEMPTVDQIMDSSRNMSMSMMNTMTVISVQRIRFSLIGQQTGMAIKNTKVIKTSVKTVLIFPNVQKAKSMKKRSPATFGKSIWKPVRISAILSGTKRFIC